MPSNITSGDRIKPGDVVRLIGGGPLMTVESVDADGIYAVGCVWFEEYSATTRATSGVLRRDTFAKAALMLHVQEEVKF